MIDRKSWLRLAKAMLGRGHLTGRISGGWRGATSHSLWSLGRKESLDLCDLPDTHPKLSRK